MYLYFVSILIFLYPEPVNVSATRVVCTPFAQRKKSNFGTDPTARFCFEFGTGRGKRFSIRTKLECAKCPFLNPYPEKYGVRVYFGGE
jgi:hypothetical protein